MADVRTPSLNTSLDPGEETLFRQWIDQNHVPFDPQAPPSDYDMRGYWRGLQQGDPMARPSALDPNDSALHYPDYYKNPSHQTFSNESRLAQPSDPQWVGNQLQQGGKVLFDDSRLDPLQQLLKAMGQVK